MSQYLHKSKQILPSDFEEPINAFPIVSQKDVDKAAHRLNGVSGAEEIKAAIVRIAKQKGLTVQEGWDEDENP